MRNISQYKKQPKPSKLETYINSDKISGENKAIQKNGTWMKNPLLQTCKAMLFCHTKGIKKINFFFADSRANSCPEMSFCPVQQHVMYTGQYLEELICSS